MKALMQGKSRGVVFTIAGFVAAAVIAGAAYSWLTKPKAQAAAPPAIPVLMAAAGQQDVPIYYGALGTVMALNTVSIRAQVTGQIVSIDFRQGQDVKKGDVLAKIDPAPFRAAFDQAVAKKAQDQALLIDAQKDLERFKTLVVKNVETQQNVDAQQAKVDQLKATVDADQAAIEAAKTQLDFTTIAAPIDGVVGFRQIDIGNIIHTGDANPLTVLTQIKPSVAVFTLAQGHLLLIDNQIDQTTSTIRMKAEFPNQDDRLWPGEFVRIRALVTTRKDAVTVPAVVVQRGPDGLYAWVIKSDNTVEQRPIQALTVSESLAVVTKGLSPGEHVVTDGQSRLDVGTRVVIKPAAAARLPDHPGHRNADRRQPGNHGRHRCDSAGAPVRPDRRCDPDELREFAGLDRGDAAIRSQSQHRRRRGGRAGGNHRRRPIPAEEPDVAADLQESESRRFTDLNCRGELHHAAANQGRRFCRERSRHTDFTDYRRVLGGHRRTAAPSHPR